MVYIQIQIVGDWIFFQSVVRNLQPVINAHLLFTTDSQQQFIEAVKLPRF